MNLGSTRVTFPMWRRWFGLKFRLCNSIIVWSLLVLYREQLYINNPTLSANLSFKVFEEISKLKYKQNFDELAFNLHWNKLAKQIIARKYQIKALKLQTPIHIAMYKLNKWGIFLRNDKTKFAFWNTCGWI